MAYEVTATRKRPKTLDGLVGQEFVVATLKNSIQEGRIAHAYLFSGPRGVGKTSAARILARSLNCPEGPSADGCINDTEGDSITRGTALDVIEIDGASNTSVNDVRQIKDEVLFPPNNSRYKIYIIDEVHMLSMSAFNALLKTIEEPPPYIVFLFATTELHKVPATIKSRCQQFHFRLIPMEKIQEKLAEAARELRVDVDADALMWIAKEGRGSLRDAYTLFDQVLAFSDGHITLGKIREKLGLVGFDRLNTLCEALADARLQQVLDICEEIIAGGVSVDQFILDLGEYFRNLLFLQAGVQRESVIGYRVKEFSSLALESWTEHQLLHAIDELLEVYRRLRFTMNERFELELVLGKLCRLKDYIDQGEMLNRIHDLRRQVEQGSFVYSKKAEISEQKTETQAALVDDVPAQSVVTVSEKIRQEGSVAQKQADTKELGSEVANSTACGTEEASLRNLELSDFERLIEKVNTQSMSLGSALAGAISHTFDDANVYVTFSAAFAAETVEQGASVIENCIHTVLGVPLKLQVVCTMAGEETSEEAHPDPQVEMSRKIFRGKIVSG